MRMIGWYKAFHENASIGDIPSMVKKLEIVYRVWQVITVLIAAYGIRMMTLAHNEDLKQIAFGLFIAILGAICLAIAKTWTHVQLSMFWMIHTWQTRKWKTLDYFEPAGRSS